MAGLSSWTGWPLVEVSSRGRARGREEGKERGREEGGRECGGSRERGRKMSL